mmetsp:Transcript_20497/g.61248  ORF Transcript_20497/g.61248 Transcript_20497/m.61248 type:complete len:267 (+) Transcript_20497:1207-2007(+)
MPMESAFRSSRTHSHAQMGLTSATRKHQQHFQQEGRQSRLVQCPRSSLLCRPRPHHQRRRLRPSRQHNLLRRPLAHLRHCQPLCPRLPQLYRSVHRLCATQELAAVLRTGSGEFVPPTSTLLQGCVHVDSETALLLRALHCAQHVNFLPVVTVSILQHQSAQRLCPGPRFAPPDSAFATQKHLLHLRQHLLLIQQRSQQSLHLRRHHPLRQPCRLHFRPSRPRRQPQLQHNLRQLLPVRHPCALLDRAAALRTGSAESANLMKTRS